MSLEKVLQAFQKKGYTPNAYIDKRQYFRVLSSLMINGGEFYDEVADEIWTEAAGDRPSKELRVNQICSTIVNAQNILKQKLKQTAEQINILQNEKRRLEGNAHRQSIRKIDQINQKLNQLYSDKESMEDDYRLVTQPFGITLSPSVYRVSNPAVPAGADVTYRSNNISEPEYNRYGTNPYGNGNGNYEKANPDHVESVDLKHMFYLTLAFGFIEVIMIYGKSDFLNLIVLTCVLSIYLMNFFDKTYIRLTLGLIAISVLLDIVWLIMYAGPKWSPSEVSNNSIYQIGYMRFIVFFTIALIPLKIGVFFFLFKHRNAESQDKYIVSLGLMKIFLSANKSNPISKGLSNTPILAN